MSLVIRGVLAAAVLAGSIAAAEGSPGRGDAKRRTGDIGASVCLALVEGRVEDLAPLGRGREVGFFEQYHDPWHYKPGPAPVDVFSTIDEPFERQMVRRFTEAMERIEAESKKLGADACSKLPGFRSRRWRGTGWAVHGRDVLYVGGDRRWGVEFHVEPRDGRSTLVWVERWDAHECKLGEREETPETCLAVSDVNRCHCPARGRSRRR